MGEMQLSGRPHTAQYARLRHCQYIPPVKRPTIRNTMGETNLLSMPVAMSARRTMKPYCSKRAQAKALSGGRRLPNTLLPSRGGMGTMLNTARETFIMTLNSVMAKTGLMTVGYVSRKAGPAMIRSLYAIADMAASNRLESGPATDTSVMERDLFLKFRGFIGTGLAQPNSPEKKSIMVPIGSRCRKGLRVTLPSIFAVGSPSLLATHAWAHSCMVSARSTGGTSRRVLCRKSCTIYFFPLKLPIILKFIKWG